MTAATDGSRDMMRYDANKKSLVVAYLLWIFVGWLGLHRIYLGRVLSGIAQLLLWLCCALLTVLTLGVGHVLFLVPAIWLLIDALLIPGIVRGYNNDLIDRIAAKDGKGA